MVVPAAAVAVFESALEGLCDALLCFEIEDPGPTQGHWHLEGLSASAPNVHDLDLAVTLATRVAGIPEPPMTVERMGPRDWLRDNLATFPPLDVGRFHLRGSHVATPPPPGRHALIVDAATAFGSGEHPTTRGCLLALDALARDRAVRPRRVLDMGCGTGVLAMAAARAWRRPVLAVDVDDEAARVARDNARRNGLGARVRTLRADGFRGAAVRAAAPFDLILANILARPLTAMAPAAARALAPGGRIVLSGLLAAQETRVRNAYARQGLHLRSRLVLDTWTTLVMARR
nr:50S ribosomal protein L11 methyltransferase [Roseospira visakhapatnamensis]